MHKILWHNVVSDIAAFSSESDSAGNIYLRPVPSNWKVVESRSLGILYSSVLELPKAKRQILDIAPLTGAQ